MKRVYTKRGYWSNTPAAELAKDFTGIWQGTSKYIEIKRDGVRHHLHRWLWQELKGPIPDGYEVDHINRNKLDNRIDNLRCIPSIQNKRNLSKRPTNRSGTTGVTFLKRDDGPGYWQAFWVNPITKKGETKHFSIKELGDTQAKEAAIAHRKAVMADLAANHGYTENHGI